MMKRYQRLLLLYAGVLVLTSLVFAYGAYISWQRGDWVYTLLCLAGGVLAVVMLKDLRRLDRALNRKNKN